MPFGERILVTGGAGFIGSAFVRRVIDGNEVVVLDTFSRDALARWPGLREHPHLTVRVGSVTDPEAVEAALDGATMVVHCAAVAGIDSVGVRPARTMEVNLLGTWHVLEAARQVGGLRRFVDFSTSEVFGTHAWRVSESDPAVIPPPGEPRWTYAASKLAAEHLTHAFHREHGLPVTSLRPFNVYGPRQVGEGAVHHFIQRALQGGPVRVYNDGAQVRAWLYVDDAVDAVCRACVRPAAVGEAFNLGNPDAAITVWDLAQRVARLVGGDIPVVRVPRPGPDVELRLPVVDKARRLLGFEPRWGLSEGLRSTIAWYRGQA
ncbi:MAG: NAD-dependent epimerase/dehydratase family protein [Alphaproteobacteria bacterium]|nr:NAD-dependent epimerase/dehydratase family protein [Alphaproteobacteria bacterium]